MRFALAAILCAVACCQPVRAQVAPSTILRIEVTNVVRYVDDAADVTTIATNLSATTAIPIRNFRRAVLIGDIVAVNGQPAKGTIIENTRDMILRTTPTPGQGIADITRDAMLEWIYEILNVDGSPVGSLMVLGVGGGTPPPGATPLATQGNNAIVGGTGAFLGARGYLGGGAPPVVRTASMTEDPSNRINNGGGKAVFILQVIPLYRPEISTTAAGPAVVHSSDFSPVSAAKPAAAGEILSLFATGLGPTRASLDPGQPFPSSPLAVVSSPVEVTLNGKSAEVLGAVGYPGAVDGYQVNFQVPPNTPKGAVSIQLTAAWIAGAPVTIMVQ